MNLSPKAYFIQCCAKRSNTVTQSRTEVNSFRISSIRNVELAEDVEELCITRRDVSQARSQSVDVAQQ